MKLQVHLGIGALGVGILRFGILRSGALGFGGLADRPYGLSGRFGVGFPIMKTNRRDMVKLIGVGGAGLAMGAAAVEPCSPCSTITAIAILGSWAGA